MIDDMRREYEERPYYRRIVMLVCLVLPPDSSLETLNFIGIEVRCPLVDQANISPKEVGRMAIERRRNKSHILQRSGRQVGGYEL